MQWGAVEWILINLTEVFPSHQPLSLWPIWAAELGPFSSLFCSSSRLHWEAEATVNKHFFNLFLGTPTMKIFLNGLVWFPFWCVYHFHSHISFSSALFITDMTEIHFSHSNPSDYRRIKIMQRHEVECVRVFHCGWTDWGSGQHHWRKCILCACASSTLWMW